MNIRLFIVFWTACLTSSYAQEQKKGFIGGLQGGFTSAQIHGDGISGFDKGGFMLGVIIKRHFNEKSSFQGELNYVTKGSFDAPNFNIGKYNWMKIHLGYVEMPLQYNYHEKKWIFSIGASVGILMQNKQEAQGIFPPIIASIHKTEIATLFGMGYQLSPKWNIVWRNSLSLLPIAGKAVVSKKFLGVFGGVYNQYMGFQIIYYIKP